MIPLTTRSLALAEGLHPVTKDWPFQQFFYLLQSGETSAAMAVKGEASKRGFAGRHNAVPLTVLAPRCQKIIFEDNVALLKAALQVTD